MAERPLLELGKTSLPLGDATYIMGVLNVSPDSKNTHTVAPNLDQALVMAERYRAWGATIIDIGGQSSHYDNETIADQEEIDRVLPAIEALAADGHLLSIDTWKPGVAREAVAAGAVIVNDTGAFAEIPDGCCAKVGLDETEDDLLLAYLRRLAADEPLRRRMGENARRHAASHHSLAGSARGYADFLRATVESGAGPFRALPPLSPYPEEDLLAGLVRDVTAELSDLGVEEADDALLREVAAAVVELDLDGASLRGE